MDSAEQEHIKSILTECNICVACLDRYNRLYVCTTELVSNLLANQPNYDDATQHSEESKAATTPRNKVDDEQRRTLYVDNIVEIEKRIDRMVKTHSHGGTKVILKTMLEDAATNALLKFDFNRGTDFSKYLNTILTNTRRKVWQKIKTEENKREQADDEAKRGIGSNKRTRVPKTGITITVNSDFLPDEETGVPSDPVDKRTNPIESFITVDDVDELSSFSKAQQFGALLRMDVKSSCDEQNPQELLCPYCSRKACKEFMQSPALPLSAAQYVYVMQDIYLERKRWKDIYQVSVPGSVSSEAPDSVR